MLEIDFQNEKVERIFFYFSVKCSIGSYIVQQEKDYLHPDVLAHSLLYVMVKRGVKIQYDYPAPDLILDHLYLGDWECAKNKNGLVDLGITHILTVAEFKPLYPHVSKRIFFKILNSLDFLKFSYNFADFFSFFSYFDQGI